MNNTCLEKEVERPEIIKEPPKRERIKPKIPEVKIPVKTASCCGTSTDSNNYLKKDNYLSEFSTEEEKAKARKNLGIEEGGDLIYTPEDSIPDGTYTELHGGLDSTNVSDFRNSKITLSELMDKILFKAKEPTIEDPSITYTGSVPKAVQIGEPLTQITLSNATNFLNSSLGSVKFGSTHAMLADGTAQKRSNGWVKDGISITKDNWGKTAIIGTLSLTIKRDYDKGTHLYNSYKEQITNNSKLDSEYYLKAGTAETTISTTGYYLCFFNETALDLLDSWNKTSTRYGTIYPRTSFICPNVVTPTFYLKQIDGSYKIDNGGNGWSDPVELTIDLLKALPKTIYDTSLTYVKYNREEDVRINTGASLRITITQNTKS